MSESIAGPATAREETILAQRTRLEPGVLGLPAVIMQGVALIAPAIAALFFVPFVVSLAGQNAPLAYPIGFAITAAPVEMWFPPAFLVARGFATAGAAVVAVPVDVTVGAVACGPAGSGVEVEGA